MFEPNDWNRLSRFAKKVTLGLLWLVVKRENERGKRAGKTSELMASW